jgi:spore germination cell wall hydrolase CwlJ-like protein
MVASRSRPKGVLAGPFGLVALAFSLMPTQIGYQDFATLLARQPAVAQRARAHLLASPFGTVQAAMFSFPQPLGTAIPEVPTYRLASLPSGDADFAAPANRDLQDQPDGGPRPMQFPTVNRRLKGDLMIAHLPPEREPGGLRDLTPGAVKTVSFPRPEDADAGAAPGFSLASLPPVDATPAPDDEPSLDPIEDTNPAVRLGRLYFGHDPVGKNIGTIQPWPAGEEPMLVGPAADPDLKHMATAPAAGTPSETVAPKGEVTGAGKRPKTPAERLGLENKSRAKAEKCLADAVYFESRGEPVRGQMAVAQVVMNRVFSGFYPGNVCGVVYQNANRRLACQFTFACDGIKDLVTEPDMWKQATKIARDTLDGKLWLPEIGKSTHYHAYWVHPSWVREMRKMHKIGVHSFYRPRAWGDGSDAPSWGPGIRPETARM